MSGVRYLLTTFLHKSKRRCEVLLKRRPEVVLVILHTPVILGLPHVILSVAKDQVGRRESSTLGMMSARGTLVLQ